jgi:fumarate reductase subunit C
VAHLADPHAMAAAKPGATRTAPPRMPPEFPLRGRYLAYTLFDATGAVYLLLGLLALRLVWALGSGEAAWSAARSSLRHPLYLAFHALALAAVVFVAVRFFRLFPKAQPPKIGPLRPPPQPVIHAMLYAAWALVSVLMTAILAGGIFR